MFAHGNICDSDPTKGLYRVNFKELDIESGWLPRGVTNSKDNIDETPLDIDEHVACLMDEHYEYGIIVCAYPDDNVVPVVGDKDVRRTTFKDGTFIEHNRQTKEYTINSAGKVIIEAATNVEITCNKLKVTGDTEMTGKLDVTGDIKTSTGGITASVGDIKATLGNISATIGDVKAGPIQISLTTHVHTGGTISGSTGPPT